MPGAVVARAVERLEHPLELRRRDARARGRRCARGSGCATCRARTDTGCPPACRALFSSRLAKARSSWAASARTSGSVVGDRELELRRRGHVVDRGPQDLVERAPVRVRLGPRAASSRERSSSWSMSRDSRSASSWTPAASSRRSASSMVGAPSGSAAARIAVSGVRRSWLTARSSAVFRTSLRRSARVSTTSLSSASRSSAAASSASSDGTTRSCTRRSVASAALAGTTSVPS